MEHHTKETMPSDPTSVWTDRRPCRRPDVVRQSAGKETLLYDPIADAVHVLNPTALLIWELCDGEHRIEDMEAALKHRYRVPEEADVGEGIVDTLDAFAKQGLLELIDPVR
jgi:hypothetical protein